MNIVYGLVGFVVVVIIIFYAVYQTIAALLINSNGRPISKDQKEVCKQALADGKAGSPYCRVYLKKGKCGSKKCDVIT